MTSSPYRLYMWSNVTVAIEYSLLSINGRPLPAWWPMLGKAS